jgi:Fe2+ or Zn2+ uptake regulation protein
VLPELDTSDDGLTEQQREILKCMEQIAPCTVSNLTETAFGDTGKRGLVYLQLKALEDKGLVQKKKKTWYLVNPDDI